MSRLRGAGARAPARGMSCPRRGECVGSAAASGTMVPRRPAPRAAALAAAREAAAREAARETARPAGGARSGAGSASTALMASGGGSPALATTHASSSSAGEPPSRGSTDRAAPRGGGRLAGRAAYGETCRRGWGRGWRWSMRAGAALRRCAGA